MDESKTTQVSTPAVAVAPSSSHRELDLNPVSLLKRSWALYKLRWKTFIGVQLLSWIPLFMSVLLIIGLAFGMYSLIEKGDFALFPAATATTALLVIPLIIFVILFSAVSQLAILYTAIKSEEKIGALASYKLAVRKVIPFSVLLFIVGFLQVGGFLLFIIPGILFTFWFSQAVFIFLIENETPMRSLLKSREYVRGHLSELFVAFVVFFVFSLVVSYAPSLIEVWLEDSDVFGQVIYAISLLTGFILGPLQYLYLFFIYRELKGAQPAQTVLPKSMPYVLTAVLGYTLFIGVLFFIGAAIFPRISEFLNNRSTLGGSPEYLQEARANNTKRKNDVRMLANAVTQYAQDQKKLPPGISTVPTDITSDGGVDLCEELVPTYIEALPLDPGMIVDESDAVIDCNDYYSLGYFIQMNPSSTNTGLGSVTVSAPDAELGESISETR